MRKFMLLAVAIFLVAAATAVFYVKPIYEQTLNNPLIPANNGVISVQHGVSAQTVLNTLSEQYGLPSRWAARLYLKLNPQFSYIQAGDYSITKYPSLVKLLTAMHEGDILVYRFQLIDGKTFTELMQNLENAPFINHTLHGKSRQEIAAAIGISGDPEGWFYPQTYDYTRGTKDIDILKRLYHDMQKALEKAWQQRNQNIPLQTPYEALILASIVEKETGISSERAEIAGVFERRLEKKMRLQTDPTVIYGLQSFGKPLTRKDLQTPTPYNTYLIPGLPPTPIAMPSVEAINAVMQPKEGKTLYFVASGKGGHTFTENYPAHQKAVQEYRKREQGK